MKKLLLGALSVAAILGSTTLNAKNTINITGTEYELDTVYHAKVGPGTTQTQLNLVNAAGSKLQVFYLTVNKTTPGVSMRAVCGKDMVAGTERPSAMAKRKSGNGVLYFAGTNGDFYDTGNTASNGTSKAGSPTAGCTVDRETYKTSNGIPSSTPGGNFQFSVDVDGVARISRLWYYEGTATLGDNVASFLGFNVASPNNGITIYTDKYWGTTNQGSKAGACAEVTAELVEGDAVLAGGKFRLKVTSTPTDTGDSAIPAGGYVIHGRGTSVKYQANAKALDFVNSLQPGDIVEFENVVLTEKGSTERIYPAQVVSGNPQNVGGGETLDTENLRADASDLHPRTGIGISQSGDSIIMMVVDGRAPQRSVGVRTSQLGDIMRYAGAYEAMNLDGGGSSCLYTAALGVRNNGSDGSERAVGNGIFAVVEAPEDNEIAEIRFVDWVKTLPRFGSYKPVIYGYNKYGVLVDVDLEGFTLSCPAELGEIGADGATLSANGNGTHLLTATYNGLTASIAVTVNSSVELKFRVPAVTLDENTDEYKVELLSVDGENEFSVDPKELSWSSSNTEVVTVDENGVVKAVAPGTVKITGTVGDFSGDMEVNVEYPTERYKLIEDETDITTWTVSGDNIDSYTSSALDENGIAVDYTATAIRRVTVALSKEISSWSRPDSLLVEANPGDAPFSSVKLTVIDQRNPETPVEYEYTPSAVTANVTNRVLIPVSDVMDVTEVAAYPMKLTKVTFVYKSISKAAHRLEVSKMAWVYNSVEPGQSGVESIAVTGNGFVLAPNPVNAGETVKLNVPEPVKYSVSALNGAVVAQGEGVEVSTAGLSTGAYIVTVTVDGKTCSSRLLVK